MTPGECERWDEAQSARLQEQRAAWERREQERVTDQLAGVRLAFRRFDAESFTACPWRSPRVALIAIAADGPVTFACAVQEKRDLLRSEYIILAAWPGEWSQHVFLLSDQDKVAVLTAL